SEDTKIRNAERARGKRSAYDLVQEIAADKQVDVSNVDAGLLRSKQHRLLHQLALRLLPRLLSDKKILMNDIEIVGERPLSFHRPHDGSSGYDNRRIAEMPCLLP